MKRDKQLNLDPGGRLRCGAYDTRRGSAMILAIVSLVLMMAIGMAYIQAVRVERKATSGLSRAGNPDAVVQAVIAQIQGVLYDDLMDDSGMFFNPGNAANGGADEPYDYPYTGSSTWTVKTFNGTLVNAAGGEHDDTWLASTMPDFSDLTINGANGVPMWPHITNLNGIFLSDVNDPNNTLPIEYAVTNSGGAEENWDTDVDVPLSSLLSPSTLYADADGDGIRDSRWTWAPVAKIGGVSYVMAVRMIDNSSLVNANVALSQVNNSGAYDTTPDGANAPRWWSPAELDLGAFINSFNSYTNRMTELESLLEHRLNGSLSSTLVPWGTGVGDRHHFWENGPALYGKFGGGYKALAIQDELELRYRNGLNNADREATVESNSNGLYTVLRHGVDVPPLKDVALSESHYIHFVDGYNAGTKKFNSSIPTSDSAVKIQDYFRLNPRLQMTAVSGAAVFAPRLPDVVITHNGAALLNDPSTGSVLKVDLNQASAKDISKEIRKIIEQGTPGAFVLSPGLISLGNEGFANQLAVCIKDYADSDNKLTAIDPDGTWNNDGDEIYGMEALPFITEAYTHVEYEVKLIGAGPSREWGKTPGDAGFAIEIRNPFNKPIKLTNVYLKIDNGIDVSEKQLSDYFTPAKTTMAAGEVLVLYHNAHGGSGNNDMAAKVSGSSTKEALSPGSSTEDADAVAAFNASNDVVLEMQADTVQSSGIAGTPMVYQRVTVAGVEKNPIYPISGVSPGAGVKGHKQRAVIGNGNGLNMLTVTGAQFLKKKNYDLGNTGDEDPQTHDSNLDTLGVKNKGGPTDTPGLDTSQILIRDDSSGKIRQVGELAHIAIIGPSATKTIADAWGGAPAVTEFMLDLAATGLVGASGSNLAVPHVVMMLDRFTTLSPAVDGKDNDGDGVNDNPEEQLVPGTINLNTVAGLEANVSSPTLASHYDIPQNHLLQYVLPIPDNMIRDNVIKAILLYRDRLPPFNLQPPPNPPKRDLFGSNYRDRIGLANIGELMKCVTATNDSIDVLGTDGGDTPGINGTVVDFLDNPDSTTPDGIIDDAEEKWMIARWLAQTCSTRSDIYTAYVVIQGFPSDDFSGGAVESVRFFAVFDRSGVFDQNGAVKVLGVYKMN